MGNKVSFQRLWSYLLFVTLCALSVIKIIGQDLPRIKSCLLQQNDVQPLYLASRVWLEQGDPFNPDRVSQEMARLNAAGLAIRHNICEEDCQVYYPPTALPLLALPALLPWPWFLALYMAATIALYLLLLRHIAAILPRKEARLLLWGCGLAFAPLHAGLGTCNISEILIAILLLAAISNPSKLPYSTTAVLAAVACIKPPLATIMLLAWLFLHGWRQVFAAASMIGTVAIVSLWRLRHVPWLSSYRRELAHFSGASDTPGAVAHAGIVNTGFLNLQGPLYLLTKSARAAMSLNYLLLMIMVAVFLLFGFKLTVRRGGKLKAICQEDLRLLITATACSFTLFQPTLQYYNGTLLLLPLASALLNYERKNALLVGVACATFVLPPRWFLVLQRLAHVLHQHFADSDLHAVTALTDSVRSQAAHLTLTQQWLATAPNLLVAIIGSILLYQLGLRSSLPTPGAVVVTSFSPDQPLSTVSSSAITDQEPPSAHS